MNFSEKEIRAAKSVQIFAFSKTNLFHSQTLPLSFAELGSAQPQLVLAFPKKKLEKGIPFRVKEEF